MPKSLSFEQEYTKRQPRYVHVLRYMRQAIGVDEVNWNDLTRPNLVLITDYIKKIVSANTAVLYLATIKSVLNIYKDEGLLKCQHPEKILKSKKEPQQNVALTEEELGKFIDYYNNLYPHPLHQKQKDCLTLFLIECLCGARSCDVEKLSLDNIRDGKLSYVSKKTRVLATLPAHHMLQLLLERKPEVSYTRNIKNRTIKSVAKKCGIDYPVTIFYHGQMQTRPKYL